MPLDHAEAVNEVRRLCRTLMSAPDPRRQAAAIATVLLKVESWPTAKAAHIVAYAQWVGGYPPVDSLKGRARQLLDSLLI